MPMVRRRSRSKLDLLHHWGMGHYQDVTMVMNIVIKNALPPENCFLDVANCSLACKNTHAFI